MSVDSREVRLVKSCLTGDSASARLLVQQLEQPVASVCLRMLKHTQDTEDIVQEVFLRFFRSLDRWDSGRPLLPWILTIAVNCCRTALKKRTRLPVPTETIEAFAESTENEHSEIEESIEHALTGMRSEYRTCFSLYYFGELSVEQIGEIMDRPPGTIKTWLFRVRKNLATRLTQLGYGPEANDGLS